VAKKPFWLGKLSPKNERIAKIGLSRGESCMRFTLSPLLALALFGCSPASNVAAAPPPPVHLALTDSEAYIAGNLLFIAFHEAGHMLISELELPVLGREEDAVDNLATLLLIPEEKDPDGEQMILAAAQGWFDSAAESAGEEPEAWGEHGLDKQRGYQILCLLAGANEPTFGAIALKSGMPQERVEACAGEYAAVTASWDKVLAPHVLNEDEAETAKIVVRYDAAPAALETAAALLRESEILEGLADTLRAGFRLPEPITLKASACGEANAFWESQSRELVMCYELVDWYAERAPK
jgi:hypothetical protein